LCKVAAQGEFVLADEASRHLAPRLEMSLALTDFSIDVPNFVIGASPALDR